MMEEQSTDTTPSGISIMKMSECPKTRLVPVPDELRHFGPPSFVPHPLAYFISSSANNISVFKSEAFGNNDKNLIRCAWPGYYCPAIIHVDLHCSISHRLAS